MRNKEAVEPVEKVSEAVEKIREEVTINPEVVEPVFSSLELFVPEIEKPNFKIDEVIAADFDLVVPENVEAFVLQVARAISKENVVNDTMEEIEDAFEKSMDVEMKDAGVVNFYLIFLILSDFTSLFLNLFLVPCFLLILVSYANYNSLKYFHSFQ